VNAVRRALGDYTLELPAAIFDARQTGSPFDLAKLPKRRFVSSSESGDITLNHDRIKQLSGGDSLRAADKYQKSFEFDPVAKLWLSCNQRPRTRDESAGFWARVVVIPFTESFVGREDTGLRDRLKQDRDCQRAVLAWMVAGAVRYYATRSLGVFPQIVREASGEYRDENDRLSAFYDACCVFDSNAKAQASELFAAYQRWAGTTGIEERFQLKPKSFGLALASRGLSKAHRKDGAYYFGIAVRDDRGNR
jgi:putative DNA primase/helicase